MNRKTHVATRIMNRSDSLRELASFGSPVDLAVARDEFDYDPVEILQGGRPGESVLLELDDGRTGCMLYVCVTSQSSRGMYSIDLELRSSRNELIFDWLVPHTFKTRAQEKSGGSSYTLYRFPGKSGFEFLSEDVLNHRFVSGQVLPPRCPVEGWLLALGGKMPRNLSHGEKIDCTFILTTSDHVRHCQPVCLFAEPRSLTPRISPKPSGLFTSARPFDMPLKERISDIGGSDNQRLGSESDAHFRAAQEVNPWNEGGG